MLRTHRVACLINLDNIRASVFEMEQSRVGREEEGLGLNLRGAETNPLRPMMLVAIPNVEMKRN